MANQETSHEEVQWNLLEMGASLGLDVWVARNDRNRSFGGHAFQDAPRLREALPRQFEPQVMSLIEHIDVLWLRGNRVEAAFEVEHTTAVYSGLLRMSDLITLHPNLMIRLYIVAPDARKSKVMNELVRPTSMRSSLRCARSAGSSRTRGCSPKPRPCAGTVTS